ncbi:MAG: ABC transporter ATP-binding protein [Planctomycetes bacterium]|nr:ABC transporter ATP-binding protein [Planctomycetota bacterium]
MSAIRIQNVSKSFGKTKALDDVSFDVPAGSIFGLLGPNGAGKTTLFSIAAGFLGADAGNLRVLDIDIESVSQLQGRMTILPQDAAFQRNVPILDQLVFLRRLDGSDTATAKVEVLEALEKVGIAEYSKRGIHALSHGMLKRLGVAQAFLGSPEVIILDEPTSGLDPQNARQIRDLVSELQRSRNVTTIVSSHNLAEIQELCDHVAILDKGRVRAAGPVAEITRQGHVLDLTTSRPIEDEDRLALMAMPCRPVIEVRSERRYRLRYAIPDEQTSDDVLIAIVRALTDRGIAPRALSEGNTLEEFFLSVTGDGAESGSDRATD